MTDIIAVGMQLFPARVGFNQEAIIQAAFPEHASIGLPVLARTDVTARLAWIDAITVLPPAGSAFLPVLGLELEYPTGTGHSRANHGNINPVRFV